MKKNYLLIIALFSFVFSYSQCDHTFVMNDSYGDGWNGSTVDILVDGVVVVEAATAADAGVTTGSTESLLFNATEGSLITLADWVTGTWTEEVSWSIIDGAGILLASGLQAEVVDVTANCTPPSCYVPAITSWNMTSDGVIFDGTNQEETIGYTLEYSETTFTPGDGTATVYEFDSFPHTLTGLSEVTTYFFAMQSNCGDSVSDWVGSPDEWTTTVIGATAYEPIVIESIPYATSDDTINYGDDYTNTATGCDSGSGSYLGGDDVVYSYTANADTSINISLTPSAAWSGIYVYTDASDIGVNCWLTMISSTSATEMIFDLEVYEGNTYYFVISTWPPPQNVAYDLAIVENTCVQPDVSVAIDPNCSGGEGVFYVSVDITDLGSSTQLTVEDGVTSLTANEASILNFGPYDSGTTVNINVVADDPNCNDSFELTYICPPTGSVVDDPIIIDSIPYSTSDDTINYGDDYQNPGFGEEGYPLECDSDGDGINDSAFYLTGDDVIYLYTAASTMSLNVYLAPSIGEGQTSANYAGMYVYENAEDIGKNCWIATMPFGFSSDPNSLELSVTEGSTYYFVISTNSAPQNVAYDLSITELLCASLTNLTVTNVTSSSADVSWDAGEAVSWEYVSFPSEDSSFPTEAGESLSEPNVSISDLNPISAYTVWVRAICDDGSISEWTSFSFNTAVEPIILDCEETYNNSYCYDTGLVNSAIFTSGDGSALNLTINSGQVENNFDELIILDSDGTELYNGYGDAGDVSGLTFQSTGDTITITVDEDVSVSCAENAYTPVDITITCASLSVNDFDLTDLVIYPNPVSGDYVTIQSSVSGEKNIEVYDITGKRLINTILNSDKLDISSVSSGVYLVKVTIQGQTKVSKLVIR